MLRLSPGFAGSILDFGCGLGDALAIYRRRYPAAALYGLDHSEAAIKRCQEHFGNIAELFVGRGDSLPEVDIIVASNVLEHLTDDKIIVESLLLRCRELYAFVPYKEHPLCSEHLRSYDESSFSSFHVLESKVFSSHGATFYARVWHPLFHLYLKNLVLPFFGKPFARRGNQIMFRIACVIRNQK